MNDRDAWAHILSGPSPELTNATLELHWAVQIVAGAAQTFAEPHEDDSHRAMSWDPRLQAFVGVPFAGAYPFRLGVRPADLTLQLFERSGEALGSLPLAGHTLDDGYSWLSVGLATYMGGAPRAIERPEYDLPSHPVASGKPFSPGLLRERNALSALYDSAHGLLSDVADVRDEASSVLCWPHHFDIATLLTLERSEEVTKTVGVGMAPMGSGYESWYWYVTPWPYPDTQNLPALGSEGTWHTDGWVGGVLSGERVVAAPPKEREGLVRGFTTSAVAAAIAALAG